MLCCLANQQIKSGGNQVPRAASEVKGLFLRVNSTKSFQNAVQ